MSNYPIYNRINRQGENEVVFGATNSFDQIITVGASKQNAHFIGLITVSKLEDGDGNRKFELELNGKLIKTVLYNKKTKLFSEV